MARLRGHRHVAVALAISLLAFVVSPWAPRVAAEPPEQPIRWLAPGDSYTAGFGLPGVNLFSGCTQSTKAWPRLAQEVAGGRGFEVAELSHRACSGGKIDDLRSGQLRSAGSGWDLVTFSVGGNDVGFRDALLQCIGTSVAKRTATFRWLQDRVTGCPSDGSVRGKIDALAGAYTRLLDDVASRTRPGGHVVVVGYPAIFETHANWNLNAKVIGLCHGIDRVGVERIRGWAGRLNEVIGQAVGRADARGPNGVSFTFVNVNDGRGNVVRSRDLFEPPGSAARHNLCGSESWMFGLHLEDDGLFHPNEKGHGAQARLVAATISELPWGDEAQGLDREAVFNAPIPSLCGKPAGRLVAGRLPGIPDDEGFLSLSAVGEREGVLSFGDLTGDGLDDAAAGVSCSAGGVAFPESVEIFVPGPDHLASIDLATVVPDEVSRLVLEDLSIAGGLLTVRWRTGRDGDPSCCPSLPAVASFRVSRSGDVTVTSKGTLDEQRAIEVLTTAVNAGDSMRAGAVANEAVVEELLATAEFGAFRVVECRGENGWGDAPLRGTRICQIVVGETDGHLTWEDTGFGDWRADEVLLDQGD